jgi:hypothetical protein
MVRSSDSPVARRIRTLCAAMTAGIACVLSAHAAHAQGQPPPGPPNAVPPKPIPRPLQWWCEVYAQPASSATLTQDERGHDYFFSQIFEKPHPQRDDEDTVERRCRTSFEVQFGGRWTLVSARAMSAPSRDRAESDRTTDENNPVDRGRTRDFRMPEDY